MSKVKFFFEIQTSQAKMKCLRSLLARFLFYSEVKFYIHRVNGLQMYRLEWLKIRHYFKMAKNAILVP